MHERTPKPVLSAFESLVLENLRRTPSGARFYERSQMFIDGESLLLQIVGITEHYLDGLAASVDRAKPLHALRRLVSAKRSKAATEFVQAVAETVEWEPVPTVPLDPFQFVHLPGGKFAILDEGA